jgi:hypothetical protein
LWVAQVLKAWQFQTQALFQQVERVHVTHKHLRVAMFRISIVVYVPMNVSRLSAALN